MLQVLLDRKLRTFNDDDYLLLAGDPVAIALASAIAARTNGGRLKMLKWDREQNMYFPLEADTNHNIIIKTKGE